MTGVSQPGEARSITDAERSSQELYKGRTAVKVLLHSRRATHDGWNQLAQTDAGAKQRTPNFDSRLLQAVSQSFLTNSAPSRTALFQFNRGSVIEPGPVELRNSLSGIVVAFDQE
jgi:hypothetical protein